MSKEENIFDFERKNKTYSLLFSVAQKKRLQSISCVDVLLLELKILNRTSLSGTIPPNMSPNHECYSLLQSRHRKNNVIDFLRRSSAARIHLKSKKARSSAEPNQLKYLLATRDTIRPLEWSSIKERPESVRCRTDFTLTRKRANPTHRSYSSGKKLTKNQNPSCKEKQSIFDNLFLFDRSTIARNLELWSKFHPQKTI